MLLFPLMISDWMVVLNFLVVCNGLLADSGADAAHRDRGLRADLLQVRPPGEAGSAGLFRVLILIFLLI